MGKTLLRISELLLGFVGSDDRQNLPLQRSPAAPILLSDSPRRNLGVKSRYQGSNEGVESQGSSVFRGRGAGYAWPPPIPRSPTVRKSFGATMMCCSLVLGHAASVSSLRGNFPLLRARTYFFHSLMAPRQPGRVPWHSGGYCHRNTVRNSRSYEVKTYKT